MSLSARERWLVALLPPVLLLGLWAHLVGGRFQPRQVQARARLERGPAADDVQARLAWTRDACARLGQDLAAARARAQAQDERRAALRARWARPAQRAASVRALLDLFEAAGVAVARSASLPREEAGQRLSPPLQELAGRMKGLGAESPQLWCFELEGGYDALSTALEACGGLEHFGLPVTLAARPRAAGPHDASLALTLWLWI